MAGASTKIGFAGTYGMTQYMACSNSEVGKFYLRNLPVDYRGDDGDYIRLYFAAKLLSHHVEKNNRAMARAMTVCELYAEEIPNNRIAPQNESEKAFQDALVEFFNGLDNTGKLSVGFELAGQKVAILPNPMTEDAYKALFLAYINDHTEATQYDDFAEVDADEIGAELSRAAKKERVSLLLEYMVAFATRGNITQTRLGKVVSGFNAESPVAATANETEISAIWDVIGPYIDETNAEMFIAKWAIHANGIGNLRMKLVFEQAKFSGLTVYHWIIEVIEMFDGIIDWGALEAEIPNDFAEFRKAANIIKGNPFYGYAKDLSDVAATRYKNLGYFARQVKLVVTNDQSVKHYQGLGNVPKKMQMDAAVDELANHIKSKAKSIVSSDAGASKAAAATLVASHKQFRAQTFNFAPL